MTPERLRRFVRPIDAVSAGTGRVIALLILPLVGGLTWEVVARYGFDAPTAWAYDLSYMLYGSHFMLGAAYTLRRGGHIRTDIFYQHWSVRRRGLVDATLYLLFFFPGLIFFFWMGWQEASHAYAIGERAETTAWQPPLWPLKMVVPVAALLLLLQGVAEFFRSLYAAVTGRQL
jgi:TRAP-type mannitol/chloroaromatic compound transport system permease small subunit